MRIARLLVVLTAGWPLTASGADSIAPGMSLPAVKEILRRQGYDVDTIKYGLSIASGDKQASLEFCRIDEDITLVIVYRSATEKVVSLDVYFIPTNRTNKLQFVVRQATEIQFEEGAVYSLKLRRKPDRAAAPK